MADVFFASSWNDLATVAQVNAEAVSGAASDLTAVDPAGVGGKSLLLAGNARIFFRAADPGNRWCLHFFGEKTGGGGQGNNPFLAPSNASVNIGVHIRAGAFSGNRFNVFNGSTALYTSPQNSADEPAHYRLDVYEHATEGWVKFWRNTDLLYHGEDLNTSRGHAVDRLLIGHNSAIGDNWRVAHVILASEDLGSGVVVEYLPVSSDEGPPHDFARSAGDDAYYEYLDDVPTDGDDTYLRSEDVGDATRHGIDASSLGDREIIAVQVRATARLEAEGLDRIGLTLRSGTETVADLRGGIDDAVYTGRGGSWIPADPDGDTPWSAASLSDCELEFTHAGPEE